MVPSASFWHGARCWGESWSKGREMQGRWREGMVDNIKLAVHSDWNQIWCLLTWKNAAKKKGSTALRCDCRSVCRPMRGNHGFRRDPPINCHLLMVNKVKESWVTQAEVYYKATHLVSTPQCVTPQHELLLFTHHRSHEPWHNSTTRHVSSTTPNHLPELTHARHGTCMEKHQHNATTNSFHYWSILIIFLLLAYSICLCWKIGKPMPVTTAQIPLRRLQTPCLVQPTVYIPVIFNLHWSKPIKAANPHVWESGTWEVFVLIESEQTVCTVITPSPSIDAHEPPLFGAENHKLTKQQLSQHWTDCIAGAKDQSSLYSVYTVATIWAGYGYCLLYTSIHT